MVQDPNFWRRFSIAVHNDKEDKKGKPDLSHSYVPSPSPAPASPTSQSHLFSPMASVQNISIISPPAPVAFPKKPRTPTTPPTTLPKRQPSKLKKSPSRASTKPLLPKPLEAKKRRPSLPALRSPSALSLSGRPRPLFKTWTTIEANPHNRDSWLESQKKKSRQRTWICWAFWLCALALVAGVVVAVLVLKAHHVI